MNRQTQLAYLAEMGIEQWAPKQQLVGAVDGHWVLSSRQASIPGSLPIRQHRAEHGGSSERHRDGQQNKVIVNRGLAMAEMLDLQSAKQVDTAADNQTKAVIEKPVTENASDQKLEPATANSQAVTHNNSLQFDLLSSVIEDVLIIDDISQMDFASSAYQHWIRAILAAVGRDAPANQTIPQERFTWPLPNGSLFDVGEQAAKETVSPGRYANCKNMKPAGYC